MKRTALVLIALLLLMAVPAFDHAAAPAHAQSDSESALLETAFFTMEYPASWHVERLEIGEASYAIISPVPIPNLRGAELMDFEDSTTLADFVREYPIYAIVGGTIENEYFDPQENAEELLDEQNIVNTERARPTTINGADGVEVITTLRGGGRLSGLVFGVQAFVLEGDGIGAYAAAGARADLFPDYRADFDKYLRTFTLQDNSAPVVVANEGAAPITMNNYDGGTFNLDYPAQWNVSTVETFDGSLTLFAADPIAISLSDFEAIAETETPFNPALINAMRNTPMVGVLVVDVDEYWEYEYFEVDDPEELIDLGLWYEDEAIISLSRNRQVILGGGALAVEMIGRVDAFGALEGSEFGLHLMATRINNMVYILVASIPDSVPENLVSDYTVIFEYIAYSFRIK